MLYTRRDIGKLALMAVPAASLVESPFVELAQTRKPNSVIGGAAIELEYDVPAGSKAVQEVANCLEYCKGVL
jgi:hypothetical protein